MPERNVALLEKTMQHIIDNPEQHDQDSFWNDCGTPSCFAGWAMHFSGLTRHDVTVWYSRNPDSTFGANTGCAAELLGLTDEEACAMFSISNTREMLQLMVKDLMNGDELRPWQEYQCSR